MIQALPSTPAQDAEIARLRRESRLSRWTIGASAAVAAITFVLLAQFEAMEAWFAYTRAHENWELDEVPLMLCVLGLWVIGFAAMTLNRQRRAVAALEREYVARKTAEEAAVRHLESRTFFFAAASHELRTPLNAIIGFSDLLREQPYGPIPQREYEAPIRFINEAGADLLATLNQMLDADAILTNDNYPIAETELDVEDAVNRVRTLLSATMNRPLKQLKLENKARVACIRFDPLRLSHLLKNMISNAVKFSPPESDVVIRLSRGANHDLLLSVIDQGCGITPEIIDSALSPRPARRRAWFRDHPFDLRSAWLHPLDQLQREDRLGGDRAHDEGSRRRE